MIWTSYFSKYKGHNGVSISRWCKFWTGQVCQELMPTEQILRWWKSLSVDEQSSLHNQAIYECLYRRDVLNKLNVFEIAKRLESKVLLCYEKTQDFCHRHIVSKWFKEHGISCMELKEE